MHAETIAVAVAEGRSDVRSFGIVANTAEAVGRVLVKLGKTAQLKVCYEACPTGYALYWQLTKLGIRCEVIAPSLVPTKAGDRIKTDRRDAEKLVLEVDHQAQRIERPDGAIDRAVSEIPEQLRALVDALQALRGVARRRR